VWEGGVGPAWSLEAYTSAGRRDPLSTRPSSGPQRVDVPRGCAWSGALSSVRGTEPPAQQKFCLQANSPLRWLGRLAGPADILRASLRDRAVTGNLRRNGPARYLRNSGSRPHTWIARQPHHPMGQGPTINTRAESDGREVPARRPRRRSVASYQSPLTGSTRRAR